MNNWNGDYVSQQLTLRTENPVEGFQELLGIALRKNKKRAHLLVSTVLGKHIPQSPKVISYAAGTLAAQVNSHDHRNWDAEYSQEECRETHLQNLLAVMRTGVYTPIDIPLPSPYVVFGYAETATSLGALVAEHLNASYIHSTRYPLPHTEEYGKFDESHSHATAHHITPEGKDFLNDYAIRLVLVDDEITTGDTIMNTIRLFHSVTPREEYYVATLTDLRTEEAHQKFAEFQDELGIRVHVMSILHAQLSIPDGSVETAQPIIDKIKSSEMDFSLDSKGQVQTQTYQNAHRSLSKGVTASQLAHIKLQAVKLSEAISVHPAERILILGIEENMYFPLQAALAVEAENPEAVVHSSSTTRSPVVAFNKSTYAIRDRIRYEVEDSTRERYVYNVGNEYDRIVLITNSAEETAHLHELILALTQRTKKVNVIEALNDSNFLQAPLHGDSFSSYSQNDVEWLLKDLSNAQLEAPTEDREESIQSGGSHYAESLPIEYMPSEEYQSLFQESLQETGELIAEAVAFVSEQVYTLKQGNPVLVSLARAGTPVGVLMKRYLSTAYGINAPHYAVSIVRGKGIDYNALKYIAQNHNPDNVIFVDGWTGKGAITKELSDALDTFAMSTGIRFSPELAVLADPGSCVTIYGTREDYLIPSACLNSTVSGLISRTVLNEDYIGEYDYHGAKFYKEFAENDMSNQFIDTVSARFTPELSKAAQKKNSTYTPSEPDWSGWKMVQQVSEEYGINDVNLVKPGVGETTRVLLRRVPWRILVRPQDKPQLKHILLLAEQRGVFVEERDDLPYACIGLIHPKFTKGAVGSDGNAA